MFRGTNPRFRLSFKGNHTCWDSPVFGRETTDSENSLV